MTKKINLLELNKVELRKLNAGCIYYENCACACAWINYGGSSPDDNSNANHEGGLVSPECPTE
jgi:hypothetical protein